MASGDVDPELTAVCLAEHRRLVGLAHLYVGDLHVAEEIAQEAFVRLHLQWHRTDITKVHAWLSTVAMNLARSWWRRRFAEHRANRRLTLEVPRDEPDTADVIAVREAVVALPARQRAVIALRFYAGLSVAETATALGFPEGTVKSLTHHAINQLRRVIDAELPEELTRA